MKARPFQVSCWPDTGDHQHDEDNQTYRNVQVLAKHSVEAKNAADKIAIRSGKTLPPRRRYWVSPVED